MNEASVKCHCGAVTGHFRYPSSSEKKPLQIWECNCSDCGMRRNTHLVIPSTQFTNTTDEYTEKTTLYQWGTKTAVRRFCKTCGILPWYQPRSNPDGIGLTVHCIDWGTTTKPKMELNTFNGQNWEEQIQSSKIVHESKT
jgi:hypothetical protein